MGRTARGSVKVRRQGIPSRTVSAEEISRIAYELFERRGCVHGHDLEDWLEAERIARAGRRGTVGRSRA